MKKLLFFISVLTTTLTFSQKEANIWYFGENAGLDFNSGSPVPITGGQINTREGCSSFSDSNGSLLFYSDGRTVWNKNHQIMNFSDGTPANNLAGNSSSTQSGMIIPRPGSTTEYYLFTVGAFFDGGQAGFKYYTIDFTTNNLGEVTAGPVDLDIDPNTSQSLASSWTEKVAAVRGSECNTFWVVSMVNNLFFAYKVDQNGVQTTPQVSTVDNPATDNRGYLKLSPDGTRLAVAHYNNQGGESNAILYSFDSNSGVVSNDGIRLTNNNDGFSYGLEFSKNSSKVYVSTYDDANSNKVFQFDLTATDILNSKFLVIDQSQNLNENSGSSNQVYRSGMQLGPDGKIYVTTSQQYTESTRFLDVINNPDAQGAACDFQIDAVNIAVNGNFPLSSQGLPPFISSLFSSIELTDSSNTTNPIIIGNLPLQYCVGGNVSINPEPVNAQTGTTITYEWSFNNGTTTTNISNTANLSINNLSTSNTGEYSLTVTLTDPCGNPSILEGSFELEIFNNISIISPSDINFCDADNDGFNTFNFTTSVTPTVLGSQNPTGKEVVYYLTANDAANNTNPISDPANYTNPTAFSNQTIWVRIHNTAAPNACNEITDFELNVFGVPVAQTPNPIVVCDDTASGSDTDGLYATFLLNTKDAEILGTLPASDYTVTYHTSQADADANTAAIDKNNDYQSASATIYIRVENNNNTSCNDTSKTLTLTVNSLPVITTPVDLRQCDDDTDGFSDFNLTEANSLLSTNSANETFVYFETLADAEANTNPISNDTAYTNQTVTTDTVWARITNTSNCYRTAQVNLTVSTTGIPAGTVWNFNTCDDYLDINGNDNSNNDDTDGISTFDFSSVTTDVQALFPAVGQQLIITYYQNEADALAEQNAIADISNYRNISSPNTQQIYVRVDSELDNGCLGLGPYITLTVDPVPVANTVADLELCDDFVDGDGTNGIVQSFDLESQTAGILGSQSPSSYTVTYHLSQAEAASGSNALSSPFTNTVANRQTIYVRVAGNGCSFDRYSFDVVVNSLPTATALNASNELEVCDDDTDGSARNGFVQNIDLEAQTPTILGSQDASNFTVTYHTSLALAQSGTTPITGSFSNSVAYRQTIYVRIVNNVTTCINDTFNFDVVVNREPLANPDNLLSNLSYCDDDTDTDDTNGFVQNIDLDSQIADILGDPAVQDEDDFNVTLHLSQSDATSGNDPQSTPFTNTVANQQTIYVRIENKATGCVNDDLTFDVIVNPLPDFSVTTPQILCLNNSPLSLKVENPDAVYTYQWRDPSGTDLGTEIVQDVTTPGDYTVTATTTNGSMCQRTLTITVNESNIATLSQDDVTIVDDSNNNSITINNDNNNLGEGDYEFALLFENGNIARDYQDSPIFEGLEGGIYTILVRDKNGCGIASLAVAVIEFPKFFTPNNDGFNDTWVIKGANSYFFPESSVYIFNRQGKVMTQISIDGTGWNGLYKGDVAPSSDYWFQIKLVDRNGNVRAKNGHFSLLRK